MAVEVNGMSATLSEPLPKARPTRPAPVRWGRAEYYRLGEEGFFDGRRVERIRGEILEMSPIGWSHALAKTKTAECLREIYSGVAWVNEQNPFFAGDSDPQPDVAVIPGRALDYSGHPSVALLVVEIADTSLEYDTHMKAELYAEALVPEYWVVDLEHRQLHVFLDPRNGAYESHSTFGPNDEVTPRSAPNTSIRVADLLP